MRLDSITDRAARKMVNDELNRFAAYLYGPKFHTDEYVNRNEVLAHHSRIKAIETMADDHKRRRRKYAP